MEFRCLNILGCELINFSFRIVINNSNLVKFDILSEHSHEDIINHLNVTLLQEKNETLDDACPNIYNTELSYHQNSEPLLLNYLKEST